MIVLVCGGRHWDDQERMNEVLDRIHAATRVTLLVEGGQAIRSRKHARIWGANWQAQSWAISRRVPRRTYWAQWHDEQGNLDRSAGPKRNQRMIEDAKPDLVVAFPGGGGTADMIRRAIAAGIPVLEVRAERRKST